MPLLKQDTKIVIKLHCSAPVLTLIGIVSSNHFTTTYSIISSCIILTIIINDVTVVRAVMVTVSICNNICTFIIVITTTMITNTTTITNTQIIKTKIIIVLFTL